MLALPSLLGALARYGAKRPWLILASILSLTGLAYLPASRITVDSSLMRLLPDDSPRAKGLRTLERHIGTPSNLVISLGDAPPDDLIDASSRIEEALSKLPEVSFVESRRPIDFFVTRALTYAPIARLERLAETMKEAKKEAIASRNPLFVELRAPKEETASQRVSEALSSLFSPETPLPIVSSSPQEDHDLKDILSQDEALVAHDPHVALLFVYPRREHIDLAEDRRLFETVRRITKEEAPAGSHVRLGGAIAKRVTQQDAIEEDVDAVGLVGALLALLYIIITFRSIRAVVIVGLPLVTGVIWTMALGQIIWGTLTILTAFVGMMLVGLGLDHGLHLFMAYTREDEAISLRDAIERSVASSGHGVALAALTTTLGFGAVAFSDLGAIREFGALAALGMISIFGAYIIMFPALVALLRPTRGGRTVRRGRLLPLIASRPRLVLAACVALMAFSLTGILGLHFESSWRALSGELEAYGVDEDIHRVLGRGQSSVFLFGEDEEEARALTTLLHDRLESGTLDGIESITSPSRFIPMGQLEKEPLIERIVDVAQEMPEESIPDEDRLLFDRALRGAIGTPFDFDDLPLSVRRPFSSGEDPDFYRRIVLIRADTSRPDGERARHLAAQIDGIRIEGGAAHVVISPSLIVVDIEEILTREGPRAALLVLLALFVVIWWGTKSLVRAIICCAAALFAVATSAGALGVLGISLNLFNTSLIVAIVGMAVDGAIHLTHAYRPGEEMDLGRMEGVTRANLAALVTTAIGFGAMRFADHPGVSSMADLALVGIAASILIDVIALPALLILLKSSKRDEDP